MEPPYQTTRPRCPFYGFSSVGGVFMDQNGNQCALIQERHAPCQMELRGEKPDWNRCTCAPEHVKKNLVDRLIQEGAEVFPRVATPKEGSGSMKFGEWMEYVLPKKD